MDGDRRRSLLGLAGVAGSALLPGWDPARAAAGAAQAPAPAGPAPTGIVLRARPLAAGQAISTYDGTPGGPVLRIRKGEPLAVTLANGLAVPTSLQWHGLRCPNAVDGAVGLTGPALAPDATETIRFTPPDSGLSWFHPAVVPGQPDQTASGLRGVLVVEEAEPPPVDFDHLLALTDGPANPEHPGVVAVAAMATPERLTAVPGARVRLRVVSLSTTRLTLVSVEGARPMLLAIDGQPSSLFEPMRDTTPLAPGTRFEVMLDLPREAGATIRVIRRGTARVAAAIEPDQLLLEITTAGAARPPLPTIAALPANPLLPVAIALERAARATLVVDQVAGEATPDRPRWSVNGAANFGLPERPLLKVARGRPVTLGLTNKSPVPLALRLHGHVMCLLHARDDGWEPYWRDTVVLPPASVTHVAFVADNPGKWMIESVVFDQAAFGLRHWVTVDK